MHGVDVPVAVGMKRVAAQATGDRSPSDSRGRELHESDQAKLLGRDPRHGSVPTTPICMHKRPKRSFGNDLGRISVLGDAYPAQAVPENRLCPLVHEYAALVKRWSVEQLAYSGCCVLAESADERERVVWWDSDEQR